MRKVGTEDATARIMILRLGAAMCRLRDSSSLPTITVLPACHANNSPGWRASGAGWHPEEDRLRLSVLSSSGRRRLGCGRVNRFGHVPDVPNFTGRQLGDF